MILGITGTDGAGKGEVVRYLREAKGFVHYSARDLFLEAARERGLPDDRAHLRKIANDLRREYGNDHMVRTYIARIDENGDRDAVIESIRALDEVHYLKEQGGVLIAVDADQRLRYTRIQSRRSETDQVSFEAFSDHEKLEMNDPDPHGMQKQAVIDAADFMIENNGSLEELHKKIDEVLDILTV